MRVSSLRRPLGYRPFWIVFGCAALCITFFMYQKRSFIADMPVRCGFTVRRLIVEGRRLTQKADLINAIRIQEGKSIWQRSLKDIKHDVDACPWVRKTVVRRSLPSTISIQLIEKTPIALWLSQGDEKLIDEKGKTITQEDVSAWKHLLFIRGEEAPQHVLDLKKMLDPLRHSLPKIKKAIFLRSRRWDLFLDNGMLVKLPDTSPDTALKKLMTLLPTLMKQKVTSVDLRFSDAIIIEKRQP